MIEATSEEFHQQVCQRFNTTLKQIGRDVEVLKEWIRQQPHLPQSSSETLLTTFLIGCKNRMERAKVKIDNYYSARLEYPDYFADRDPEGERFRMISEEMTFLLPKLTPDGCRVTMAVYGLDAAKYDVPASVKRVMAYLDVRINSEPFHMGDYVIVDCAHFTMSHLGRMTPTLCRDFLYCMEDTFPFNIKSTICFNCPAIMEIAMNFIKPFTKDKIFNKIKIHHDGPEVLLKYFPKNMIPSDYGGEEESSEKLNEKWVQILREKRDWLMSEGSITVDETKRVKSSSKNKNSQEMQGSFKTLCVD